MRVQLLGGFRISVGGYVIPQGAWRLQKSRALVKLLALAPGHQMHRERLLEMLWPDLDPDSAANNLYISLHVARRALAATPATRSVAGPVRLKQHVVSLVAPGGLWIDVEAFEVAAAGARSANEPDAFRRAIDLYTGDLLPEDRYDDWITSRREALRETYLEILLRLARHAETRQDYPAAIETLRTALAAEPAREEAHVALMRLYALCGRRGDALRQYALLEQTLRRELDAEPDAESRQLQREIAQGRFPQAPPATAAPLPSAAPPSPEIASDSPAAARASTSMPAPPSAGSPPAEASLAPRRTRFPLIGRQREAAQLLAAWRAARQAPHVAIITGDPGIGKTRLAEDFASSAERQGIAVAAAHCYPASEQLAYGPLVAWLRSDALWPTLFSLENVWLTELSRLIPEILVERPSLPPAGPLSEGWQRQRLFDAFGRALTAAGKPLILLLDDLQWCDHESRQWLQYLLRTKPAAPLLVTATLRSGEAGPDASLPTFLAELRRADHLTEIELHALAPDDTLALGKRMLGRELSPAAAGRLVAESEGSPLFVVQLVRAGYVELWESGEPLAGAEAKGSGSPASLPPTLQSAIAIRLAHLSPAAAELVGVAATLGRECTFDLLVQASSVDEDTLVEGIEELLSRRIVREGSGGSYDFAHDKIREVAYGQLSAARRRVLHRRVAGALEALNVDALDPVSGQIGTHYLKAGEPAKAIPYIERAGDQALALRAYAEAERYYRELTARLDALGRAAKLVRAHEKLGGALMAGAHYDDALAMLEVAAGGYHTAGDLNGYARVLAQIGRVHAFRGTAKEGIARIVSAGLDLEALAPDALGTLHSGLMYLYFVSGQYAESLAAAERAAECGRLANDARLLLNAQVYHGYLQGLVGRGNESVQALETLLPRVEAFGDLGILCFVLNSLSETCGGCGDYARAGHFARRALHTAERLANPATILLMLGGCGWMDYIEGDWKRARQQLQRAVDMARSMDVSWSAIYPMIALGVLSLAERQWDAASAFLDEASTRAHHGGDLQALRWVADYRAEVELIEGRPEAALARLEPLLDRPGQEESDVTSLLPALAWAYLALGEETRADELLAACIRRAGASGMRPATLRALCVRALLDTRRARWSEAEAALEEALSLARLMPHTYSEAKVLYFYGLLHTARGETDLARQRLSSSLTILNALGERLYAEHVERSLNALS